MTRGCTLVYISLTHRPPFAPASQHPSREPDHFSLDSPPPGNPTSPLSADSYDVHSPPFTTVTLQQRGFDTSAHPVRPAHTREPTSSADEFLSTSRSRRLLSGYLFGNPPSPKHESIPVMHLREPSDPHLDPAHSTPPSQSRDSTPISTVSSSPEGLDSRNLTARMERASVTEDAVTQEEMRKRRSSRVRDKEIGYDALTGLSDGEADADANAAPAAFGTQEYLLGADGEAGEYRFPKHRLRTRMKGKRLTWSPLTSR